MATKTGFVLRSGSTGAVLSRKIGKIKDGKKNRSTTSE